MLPSKDTASPLRSRLQAVRRHGIRPGSLLPYPMCFYARVSAVDQAFGGRRARFRELDLNRCESRHLGSGASSNS